MAEPSSALIDALDRFNEQLVAGERQAFAQLNRAYNEAWTVVQRDLIALATQVRRAPTIELISAGGELTQGVPPSWLLQQDRYATLHAHLAELVAEVSDAAGEVLPQRQRELADQAAAEAADLRVAEEWAAVPREALRSLVGFAGDGSPLSDLLDTFRTRAGAEAHLIVEDALLAGLARGRSFLRVADELRDKVADLSLSRAQTIVRTESMRAYREAHHRSYMANSDKLSGWIWRAGVHAARSPCTACWAMHGTVHRLDERLDGHPGCRCRQIPVRRDLMRGDELLLPSGDPLRETGQQVFEALDAKTQRRILGPTRYELLRSGAVPMEAFATHVRSGTWGGSTRITTLRDLHARQLFSLPNSLVAPRRKPAGRGSWGRS